MKLDRALAERAGLCALAAVLAWLAATQITALRQSSAWLDDVGLAYLSPPRPQFRDIVILAIDEATLAELAFRSPIDRHYLAAIVDELARRDVRALGIDVIFDQATHEADDRALLAALDAFPAPVVLAYGGADSGLTLRQRVFQETYLRGRKVGSIAVYMTDGIVRELYPHDPGEGQTLPSFPVALAETLGIEVPASPQRIYFHRGGANDTPAIRKFPIHRLAALPAQWFENAIVLIGADLPNDDRFRTPLSVLGGNQLTMSGVEIHAQALAQLLEGSAYPGVTDWTSTLILLIAVIAGFTLPAVSMNVGWKIVVAAGFVGAYWVAALELFADGGPQAPLLLPTLGFLLSMSFGTAYGRREERRQKRQLRNAFQHYVAPAVIDDVTKDPSKLALGGEEREMSFVFSDLSGFTAMTEKLTPGGTVSLLQGYFEGMLKIALDFGGTVERIIGDSILVFFGAPAAQPDHARRAVMCALEWDKYCERFRREQLARGIPMGSTRIGVHTGLAVVGNVGTEQRFHYTAHGDSVNTAARLESANKHLGTRACLSAEVARHYTEGRFRPVGQLVLKGRSEALECVTVDDDMPPELLQEYRAAFGLMQARDPKCVQRFAELFKKLPNDALIAFHAARLDRGDLSAIILLEEK
ncbi:MAG TPA: adenylate/guanylate cyclase domain-containing protein [Gammaproteobacteria bacterium]|jgi:class 3 adenylate cyclase